MVNLHDSSAPMPGRIVHVITGLRQGGAESMLVRLVLAGGSPERFHVVSLGDEGYFGEQLRRNGINVTCLGMRNAITTIAGLASLARLLRRLRPTIVQSWMYHADLIAGLAARLAGVPSVIWGIRQSSLGDDHLRPTTMRIAKLNARLSRWLPDRIVSCSSRGASAHVQLGYDASRMVIIPNGFDLSRYRPDSELRQNLRRELGIPENECVLGMVARYDPMKDHRAVINAFSRLRARGCDCRLLLCGDNVDIHNRDLGRQITARRLEDSVLLLGLRSDINRVMNAIDIHVLSSGWSEGFPNVIGEAMACGTPCVATDVGDTADIVGETGWLVPPGDALQLERAMLTAIMEAREERSKRSVRCRQRVVEQFEIGSVYGRFAALWQELSSATH